jgi:hypothetical protein
MDTIVSAIEEGLAERKYDKDKQLSEEKEEENDFEEKQSKLNIDNLDDEDESTIATKKKIAAAKKADEDMKTESSAKRPRKQISKGSSFSRKPISRK